VRRDLELTAVHGGRPRATRRRWADLPHANVADVPYARPADLPSCAFPRCAQAGTLRCGACGRLCCAAHAEEFLPGSPSEGLSVGGIRCHKCLAVWREQRWEVIFNALPGLLAATVAGEVVGAVLAIPIGLDITAGIPAGGAVGALLWFVYKACSRPGRG
jgi:hypothetical protein